MRFLNLEITALDIDAVKIEFSEGVNIISISDERLFDILKYFPLISSYGLQQEATDPDILTRENFSISSYYYPENNIDLIFEQDKIKQLLINSEISDLKLPYFTQRDKLLSSKEKELINLEREKQLLELKKIKKEKLLKEVQVSEKNISKLEKRKDSIIKYRETLNEITKQIDERNSISSKINNLKKDIIELNEIKEKIKSIEDTISERFSHFSTEEDDQLPDLEIIQQSFNSFRDINEQIDKFSGKKKKYSRRLIKIIFSAAIFSLIALMFFIFTSSASLILAFISGISVGIAAITAIIYYFTIKRSSPPAELLDEKNKIENNLFDILKKNNFPIDNYKTAEIYEVLFQYFDDFIDFRDINNELAPLRKKMSNSGGLIEKEKKLKTLTSEIDKLDKTIKQTINNLDTSIHPKFAQEELGEAAHDVDELLEENKIEIDQKKSLIAKFQDEIDEYDKDEKNSLSPEMKLEETLKHINNLTDEIRHIKFLDTIFDEAVEKWSKDKLDKLSNNVIEKIMKITDNSYTREKLSECLENVFTNPAKLKEEYTELKPYISFAIKAALSESLDSAQRPPMFMINPFIPNNAFSENMKKLLPEFFPDRQVIVIMNYIDPNINGNLITLT